MIEYDNGHWRSVRTPQEGTRLLEKDLETLTPEERETIELIVAELSDPSASAGLLQTIGNLEWLRTPVDMETFVMDPYYLGNTCDNLYPRLMEDLTALFDEGYREAVLTGAIGWGKTFEASIGVCRLLYILSCMRDPHRSFGIAANSNISIVCLSVNEILATKVAYENIATKIEASPYFQENFPFEKTKKELRFPRKVWVAARASNDGSVLGLNVIGGLLDECICPKSLVFLANGRTARVMDLPLDDSVQVVSFDEDGQRVHTSAWVKKSGNQRCYELSLDNGVTLRASWHHPVLVRNEDVLDFKFLADIMVGEEVVVYASEGSEALRRSEEEALGTSQATDGGEEPVLWKEAFKRGTRDNIQSPQGTDGLGALRRDEAEDREGARGASEVRGAEGEAVGGDESSLGRGGHEPRSTSEWVGRGQSVLREAAHRGSEAEDRGCESWAEAHERGSREDVSRSVQATGRESGGVPDCLTRSDGEGGRDRLARRSGTTGSGDTGRGRHRGEFRVRGSGCEVLDHRGGKVDGSRFQGTPTVGRDQGDRSQVQGDQGERQGAGRGGEKVLQRRRMGPRRLGRELSVARVVSKRDVGVQPTYDVSVPGYECFVVDGTLVHNTNFMPKASKGQDPRFNLQDRAEVLYNAMQRRMKSRFERKGRLPGILFVVSSKQTNDDFTAKRIKESKLDPTVFVRDYALWDVKPDIYYSGDWFHVVVGNEQAPSRIIENEEDVDEVRVSLPEDCVIIAAPEDFRGDFENDLEGAIRDLAGVATVSVSPYIQRRTKIIDAIRPGMKHPFSVQVYDPSQPGRFYWHKMLRPTEEAEGGNRPILSPYAPRHIHIDPSLSGDSTGFAMGHISNWREVVRRDDDGNKYPERAPEVTFDLLLKIVPPIGGEIILGEVRKLVYQLSRHGYMITCVSIDSWNSADAIQKLSQRGFNAIQLSVDRTMGPYDLLKTGLYEDRVYYYEYEPFLQELRELEHDRLKRKVDHPLRGCFVGDTRVPLLDGTHPRIEDLVGREVWVYSARQDGTVVPGRARGRLTKNVTEFVDVVLDSGAVERCTPEHLWMLRDGSYKEARHLRPGIDRLMPVNRQWPVNGGYERLTDRNRTKVLTHHAVWAATHGKPVPEGCCVHHLNHVKTDNHPENLELALLEDHAREHTSERHRTDPEWRERLYEGARRFNESAEGRARHSEAMRRTNASRTTEDRKRAASRYSTFRSDVDPISLERVKSDPEATNANAAARILGCGRNVVMRVLREMGFKTWEEFQSRETGDNHKVRDVIPVCVKAPVPVYDLEVDEHSNFALCSGVFVHNSKDVADAAAGVMWTLTENSASLPLAILRSARDHGDAWMIEHQQASLARSYGSEDTSDMSEDLTALPPFLVGSGSGWGD